MKPSDKDPLEGILILAGFLSVVMVVYIVYLVLSGEITKF